MAHSDSIPSTSQTQNEGSSSNHASIRIPVPQGIEAMAIEDQQCELTAVSPGKSSTCMEARQAAASTGSSSTPKVLSSKAMPVDAAIEVRDNIEQKNLFHERSGFNGEAPSSTMKAGAQEKSVCNSMERGGECTASVVDVERDLLPSKQQIDDASNQGVAGSLLMEQGRSEEESRETDFADGAVPSCFDIANGHNADDAFYFYLLISPRPKTVCASVNINYEYKDGRIQSFELLKLPTQAKPFMGDYTCWRLCLKSSNLRGRLHVIITFPKAKLLGIPVPGSKESTIYRSICLRKRLKMQIEVLHKQEPGHKGLVKLALDSVLVLLSNPFTMSDCLAEYAYHKRAVVYLGQVSDDAVQKMTREWLSWIQQEFQAPVSTEGSNIEWASKMVLALLSQLHLLKHVQEKNEFSNYLEEHYVILLQLFRKVFWHLGSPCLLPPIAAATLEQCVGDLVSFTRASQWCLCLDALCNADPCYSFLKRWKPKRSSIKMEQNEHEGDYEEAISHILSFVEASPDKRFKLQATRAAILAAPSGMTFLKSTHFLLCYNLLRDSATVEEVEAFISGEYGQALIKHFKWLVEMESPMSMVKVLIEELRNSENEVLRTFMRILVTVLLRCQILPHPSHSHRLFGDSMARKVSFDHFIDIWECCHTFVVPLLSDETTFMYDLACKGDLHLAAYAILALVGKVESFDKVSGKVGIDVHLRTWLHKVCARAADTIKGNKSHAPMTPHALYSEVTKLFEKGLQSAGFLAETIDETVGRLLQQRCGLQEVLQDARKMSSFDCNVIAQQYRLFANEVLCKHIRSYRQVDNKSFDGKTTELLNWLCTHVRGDIMLDGWIQEDLCTSLLDALIDIRAENASACHDTIMGSDFKLLLLQIKLVPSSRVFVHTFYRSVLTEWTTLQKELEEQSMSLEMVSKLMNHPMASWEKVCKVQRVRSQALKGAVAEVNHYMNILLKAFFMLLDYSILSKRFLFTSGEIHGAQSWLGNRGNKCKHFTLREIKDPNHWPLKLDNHFLEAMLILKGSKLLINIYKIKAAQATPIHPGTDEEEADDNYEDGYTVSVLAPNEEENDDTHDMSGSVLSLWQNVASIMRVSLDCYKQQWEELSNLSYPAKKLGDLLSGLTQNDIELEGNLAQSFLRDSQEQVPHNFQEILRALNAWVNLQDKRSLLAPLLKVEGMLNIIEDGRKLSATLQSLCNTCMVGSIGEYLALYNGNIEAINYFSSKESVIIKQIADSEQLVCFLKNNSDDFRFLTDAIEEQAEDALVDEATVSDLIHIDKVFRPLLKSGRITLADLKAALELETQGSDLAAAQLCSKLSICSINIHRIRQFVASLADRSSVLRMNMHSIMQSGIYNFNIVSQISTGRHCHEVCNFSLKTNQSAAPNSDQNSRQYFNLSELADLRSRARMLLSRRRVQHCAFTEESTLAASFKFDQEHALGEFVEFVNLAEEFFNQVVKAHQSGHLLFNAFKWTGSGIKSLKEKVIWMDGQLSCWNAALERARLQFYCLNFFKGVELRLIHQCFSSEATQDQIQLCYELLNFVKPPLERNKVENCLNSCICRKDNKIESTSGEGSEIEMFACLQHLSSKLQEVFAPSHPQIPSPSTQTTIKETALPDRSEDSVLLVSVEKQQLELNVVVEVFCRYNECLRSQNNNLVLCSSTTSWEEVRLLLLRYLFSDEGDGSHVFVIAFIENLSFECQLQLVVELQQVAKLPFQQRARNRLALVCWIGSQALQGISHHLKVPIQCMNGYANGVIKQHLPGECAHMSVVTSELAGMGKSSNIKEHGLCITLTISREVSLESLILRLKNMNISAENSLHFDISTEEGYESLNRYLFEMLILGVLKSSDVGIFWLPTNRVYIELANTLGNRLETNLPVCSWLPCQHLVWELESLHVPEDLESDEQVVCLYLDALASNQLDTRDIVMCGTGINVLPLPDHRCKELLYHYFIKDSCQISHSVLAGFLRTLAYQLRKLSATDFYTVETLCWILRSPTPGNFRSNLVSSLLQAAKELSLRSVKPWLHGEQQQALKKDLNISMHERMSSLLGWSETNHVMIFFDLCGPITVLYRDKKLIPEAIKDIMMIQAEVMGTQLQDYSRMSSLELWRILSPILGKNIPTFAPNYALTPDNFLKMALISLRIYTQVPVIIMGETGCGKTSLLKALATYSNASFSCLTLHAGSTEQDIESFILDAATQALSDTQVWAFLDEINACPHLGFLNGILCHHTMDGNLLPPNLVVLAACNPYRLQDPESEAVGLKSNKGSQMEHHLMAYKVQPLPEAMLDYVWDYGILSDSDERAYICAMVGTRSTDIIDMLSNSQRFMRRHLGLSSVSLRDIQRWISLFDWFQVDVATRAKLNKRPGVKNVEGHSKILACSLCYHCRLPTKGLRKLYREMCCKFLKFKSETGRAFKVCKLEQISEIVYSEILHEEQLDILQRMEIPLGIALNTSLLENVFVVLVCILNYLPVFVVGKPGSGKTLALQIIYSNLRGADSKDEYFQQLPRMLMLSYQGSQNSTSEGILRVFGKAKRYVESNRERNMLVVLVLDEIGLAETSCHNPLKVLHPLLEPEVQEIAVVGISNWSLDAAKMNRGIHLSQSDPEEEDLCRTGVAIFESYNVTKSCQFREKLHGLAAAYFEYHAQQARPDFHGLRDFYSLVKSLRLCDNTTLKQDVLAHSLWRNFGGGSARDIQTFFSHVEKLTDCKGLSSQQPPVMDLIRSNLQDPEARHLLLITKGDSASSILQHMLQQDEEFAVIRGSTYKDDKNEEYCYLLLGEIILHMEMGRRILLENADQVWSSLYDMLNQHYTIVGGRKNCRIALGVYSNPMCYVHDAFRCIVIVDHEQIPQMDPPFLNRFEKQVLTYESILNESQKGAVDSIRAWAHGLAAMSLVPGGPDSTLDDAERFFFSGFFEDSVPSLVMYHWNRMRSEASHNPSQLIHRCKVDLLQTANANAIARAHLQMDANKEEAERWTEMFLSWSSLHCLEESIKLHMSSMENWADSIGVKLIVTTCTPLQWNIQQDIESTSASSQLKVYCLRLGDFTSEKQLQAHINKFWSDEVVNLLVLQADDVLDRDHIPLAKFHIDKARRAISGEAIAINKHVLLIIHAQLGKRRFSRFSFLCGWKQLTIDRLQKEPIDLRVYLEKTIPEILEHKAMPIKRIMARVLTWSYLCIKYEDKSITASYPQEMVQLVCHDEALVTCLKQRALEWVLERKEILWQLTVLNNQKLLSTSASVHDAFVQYLEEKFREALARLLYLIERTSSLKSYFLYDDHNQQAWRHLSLMPAFLNCHLAPPPRYPEGYALKRPLELQIPYSSRYAAHLDTFRQPFMESQSKQRAMVLSHPDHCTRVSNSIQRDVDASLTSSLVIIKACIDADLDSYVVDFCSIYNNNPMQTTNQALEWVLRENLQPDIYHPSDIHIVFWEREKEIRDQAALASLCLATQVIDQQASELRAGRPPNRNYKEDLVRQCCLSLLPTETYLNELGGMEGWTQKVKGFLKLVHPVGEIDMVYLLQTLHDFAVCVILPLQLDSQHLSSLAAWFIKDLRQLSSSSILKKVVASLPQLHTLNSQQECRSWMDFICSVLKRYPHLASFSEDDMKKVLLSLVTSPSPSCMIGHVLFQVLNTLFLSRVNLTNGQKSIFNALISNNQEGLFNEEWGDEVPCANSLFLVDCLYHKLRETLIPLLTGNKKQMQELDPKDFDKCFSIALQACEDHIPFSLKKVTALAFMKCFLYSTAFLLNQAYLSEQRRKGHYRLADLHVCGSTFSRMSLDLKHFLQVFFMKILHWDFGLSAEDISKVQKYCENESPGVTFYFLLDNPLLRNVCTPLGFNPFMSSSNSYMTAELALRKLVLNSNRMKGSTFLRNSDEDSIRFLKNASQEEQAAFVAAIASQLFLMKSGGPLSEVEWGAMKRVREVVDSLNYWDPLAKQSLRYLAAASTQGGIWNFCEHLAANNFRSRCLGLNILVTVMNLPMNSPLRGYCMLDESHLSGVCMLTEADNILQGVSGLGSYREFVCECGYIYIIGDCTRPNQVGICPNPKCHKGIGGQGYTLQPGNTALREGNSQRVIERSLTGKIAFSVRIQPLSYRLLRILVHYCFLIGIMVGGDTTKLASFLNSPNNGQNLMGVLTDLIESDMDLLDKLIACQREMTYQFIHSILQKLPQVSLVGPLLTPQHRDQWELAFEKLVNSEPPHASISAYLQCKRTDGLHDLLQERVPCPPVALQNYFRITKEPCFSHYGTMFMQNTQRAAQFPCVAAVLAHAKHLSSLRFLLPIVEFSAVAHHVMGHKITRQAAAVTTIQEILRDKGDMNEKYEAFEASWNSVRLLVKGYECRQFKEPIPLMDKTQPIGLCLLEKKDQGIYLTAMIEFLKTCQNDFLEDIKAGLLECSSASCKFFNSMDAGNMPSVRVQLCKAEQVICFDEEWANDLVKELGMCNPEYGKGTQVDYDDYHIEMEMQRKLIQGKSLLEGDYNEFPYQRETFQRHATLLSDVIERVPQEPLPTEKLSNINRELTMEGMGPWELLITLELCLGFLRRMRAESSDLLRDYCERWLGSDAHLILKQGVFDGIEVRHVVSLYEGLEAVASYAVEDMVCLSYRSDLNAEMHTDLMQSVVASKSAWRSDEGAASGASSSRGKLSAEVFRDVLKRFMFRYLTTDTFNPDDELHVYLTNEGLVTWPAEDLQAAGGVLDDVFPTSFQLRHARALYLALKQMCS